jgi:predicted regulator of Ras-like GTPase activity (Roadblock/LC7/MglB family)
MSSSAIPNSISSYVDKWQDARALLLSTIDGAELISASKSGFEDLQAMTSLVPSFVISADQGSKLGCGDVDYSMAWMSNGILLQVLVGDIVISVMLQETANLGMVDDFLENLRVFLRGVSGLAER